MIKLRYDIIIKNNVYSITENRCVISCLKTYIIKSKNNYLLKFILPMASSGLVHGTRTLLL